MTQYLVSSRELKSYNNSVYVCVYMCACMRACMRACGCALMHVSMCYSGGRLTGGRVDGILLCWWAVSNIELFPQPAGCYDSYVKTWPEGLGVCQDNQQLEMQACQGQKQDTAVPLELITMFLLGISISFSFKMCFLPHTCSSSADVQYIDRKPDFPPSNRAYWTRLWLTGVMTQSQKN